MTSADPPYSSASGNENPEALPPGTRLGEYEILRVLGVGGFGIVYLAFDHALEREVAVKEYMPAQLAGRGADALVSVRSAAHVDTFALGQKSFVNEARLLARFDHRSLVKVHRFWEANGTAYMVMPYYRGQTLKAVRQRMGAAPDEAWLRKLLMSLLGALETLHEAGVFHRDIAPDNIILADDGTPVLLDFGAARRVIGDRSQNLTAILKPSYAPIEQYGESGAVRQGPWTDLYALGATLHYVITGQPPAPSTTRSVHDERVAMAAQPGHALSMQLRQAIDWALQLRPVDRPQSVAALREVLEGRVALPEPPQVGGWQARAVDADATIVRPPPQQPQRHVAPPLTQAGMGPPPTVLPPSANTRPPAAAYTPPPAYTPQQAPQVSAPAPAPASARARSEASTATMVFPGPNAAAAATAAAAPKADGGSRWLAPTLAAVAAAAAVGVGGWVWQGGKSSGDSSASAASAAAASVAPPAAARVVPPPATVAASAAAAQPAAAASAVAPPLATAASGATTPVATASAPGRSQAEGAAARAAARQAARDAARDERPMALPRSNGSEPPPLALPSRGNQQPPALDFRPRYQRGNGASAAGSQQQQRDNSSFDSLPVNR